MELPHQHSPRVGWIHELKFRFFRWWPAKMIGTSVGMAAFFVVYFWLLRHPLRPVTIMPLTAVDRWIGFWPMALPFYLSLWVYVSLAPGLVRDGRELKSLAVAAVGVGALGLGIFFVWPTAVPPADVDWAQHPGFGFLKAADAAGNACPSLHVAFAVFAAFWFERLLRQMGAARWVRALNWLWCVAILYSTIATRQHVSLDVLAGAVLGAIAAWANFRWLRRAGDESAAGEPGSIN